MWYLFSLIYSLEVLEELGEWAVRACIVLVEVRFLTELGSVGSPLLVDRKVVVHPLMADEEVLVTPVGSSHLRLGDHLGNFLFSTAKRDGHCESIDVPHGCARWDRFQIVSVVIAGGKRPILACLRFECELPGEDGGRLLVTILRVSSHL